MNTNKQINIMILLVFVSVLLTGGYWLLDPDRATSARDDQLNATRERGAWLYSQNCRTCHGDMGEGGAASNRLRQAPALNRPDLRGVVDGEFDPAALTQAYDLVFNTITCGRVGKAMPTWGQSQGGVLNEEQIKQLATFITEAVDEEKVAEERAAGNDEEADQIEEETAWNIAEEFALEGAPKFDLHSPDTQDALFLVQAIGEDDTEVVLTSRANPPAFIADATGEGLRLQIGDELMLVTSLPDDLDPTATTGTVNVERGLGTTDPAPHDADAVVLEPPVPPDPPSITEKACGQTASAQPTAAPEAPSGTLSIIASGIAWNKTELFALPNTALTLTLDNQDDGTPHNIRFSEGAEPGGDEVARTEIENGPVTQTLLFGPLDEGDYYYVCEVHTQMEGVLHASTEDQSGGAAAPNAAATPAP